MARINSVHEAPVHVGSVGYHRVTITGPHTGPAPLEAPGPKARRGDRRRRAKAALAARRDEVAKGAGFLERLTTTRKGGS